MVDSGASSLFIHSQVYEYLLTNDFVKNEKDVDFTVSYANSASAKITKAILLNGIVNDLGIQSWFLVLPVCLPRIILGRPLLGKLGLMTGLQNPRKLNVHCCKLSIETSVAKPTTSWVERKENYIVIHAPLLENCYVLPYREKKRNHSITDTRIMYARLRRMELEGKVESMEKESGIILATVFVDKLPDTPRVFIDNEELYKRSRVTLDARPVNSMRLVRMESGGYAYLPQDPAQITKKDDFCQAMPNIIDCLNGLSASKSKYFAKLDMKDAYSSLRLSPELSRFFCLAINVDGKEFYFRYISIPQGWVFSSYFFYMAMFDLLREINPVILARFGAVGVFYQDDITVGAGTSANGNDALQYAVEFLRKLDFHIREEKCRYACDTIDFCGFQIQGSLSGCLVSPHPKSKLSHDILDMGWAELLRTKEPHSWVRSWCGKFNYFRSFIDFDFKILEAFGILQSCLKSNAVFDNANPDELKKVQQAYHNKGDYCLHNLPSNYFGTFDSNDVLGSLLICDANQESYSAILLRIMRVRDNHSDKTDPMDEDMIAV